MNDSFKRGFIKGAASRGINEYEAVRLLKLADFFSDNPVTHGATALMRNVGDWFSPPPNKPFAAHYQDSINETAAGKASGALQKFQELLGKGQFDQAEPFRNTAIYQANRSTDPNAAISFGSRILGAQQKAQYLVDENVQQKFNLDQSRQNLASLGNKPIVTPSNPTTQTGGFQFPKPPQDYTQKTTPFTTTRPVLP